MNAPANLFTDGKAYERLMGRWSHSPAQNFSIGSTRRRPHWVDVGCGNGAFTEVLIARAAPQRR